MFTLICVLINLGLTEQFQLINIAHGKPIRSCDINTTLLTDGNTNIPERFETDSEDCYLLWFFLDFGGEKIRVRYVVVFIGKSNVTEDDAMDNFKISLKKGPVISLYPTMCGSSNMPLKLISNLQNGVRLNCQEIPESVGLQMQADDVFRHAEFSEIEVYHFGRILIHRGCFKSPPGNVTTVNDLESCRILCTTIYYNHVLFIGDNLKCACASSFNDEGNVTLSECNQLCPGGKGYCGGRDRYSAYITNLDLPEYEYCMTKQLNANFSQGMTITKCMSRCKKNKYAHVEKEQCTCFDDNQKFGELQKNVVECCFADVDNMCREDLGVVFRLCPLPLTASGCYELFQCKEGTYNMYGVCTEGCKPGFSGEYCMERDMYVDVGGQSSIDVDPQSNASEILSTNPVSTFSSFWVNQSVGFVMIGSYIIACLC